MSMEQLPRKPSAVALIVESDLLRRHEMAARLRRGGFEVFEAADAAEAITVLKKHRGGYPYLQRRPARQNGRYRLGAAGPSMLRRYQRRLDLRSSTASERSAVALGYVHLAPGPSKPPPQSLQFSGGAMDTLACIGVLDFNNPAASSAYSVDGVHA